MSARIPPLWAIGDRACVTCDDADGRLVTTVVTFDKVTELGCGCLRLETLRPGGTAADRMHCHDCRGCPWTEHYEPAPERVEAGAGMPLVVRIEECGIVVRESDPEIAFARAWAYYADEESPLHGPIARLFRWGMCNPSACGEKHPAHLEAATRPGMGAWFGFLFLFSPDAGYEYRAGAA